MDDHPFYGGGDVPMNDPFMSLETNLDDIQNYLGPETMDFELGSQDGQNGTNGAPKRHSPPQEHYDMEGHRDVSSLHSLLHRNPDDYYSMRFSPPNFDMSRQSTSTSSLTPSQGFTGIGRDTMLSEINAPRNASGSFSDDIYQPLSLVQQLAAPAMTPKSLYVNTNGNEQSINSPMSSLALLSPPHHHPQLSHNHYDQIDINGYHLSPPHFHQQGTSQQFYDNTNLSTPSNYQQTVHQPSSSTAVEQQEEEEKKPKNTKEELLQLLASMTSDDVEKLKKTKKRQPAQRKVSAVEMVEQPTIIQSPQQQPQLTIKEDLGEDDDEDDSDSNDNMPIVSHTRRGPKTERRTAHNLIEKKYRCSINDRIQQLKSLLCGDDAKLSKSATLRRAIEHIENIERENARLKYDVENMQRLLNTNGIQYKETHYGSSEYLARSPIHRSLSPPETPQKKRGRLSQKITNGVKSDTSRVTLFAMLMAVLFFNPFAFLLGTTAIVEVSSSDSRMPVASPFQHGRIIGDTEEQITTSGWFNFFSNWYTYSIVIVFLAIMVLSEKVVDFTSEPWQRLLTSKNRARAELQVGNLKEAQRQFYECLIHLGKNIPAPGYESYGPVVYAILRHALNWLWVGRWISRRRQSQTMPKGLVCRSHAQTAIIYHELHQLNLMGITGHENDSGVLTSMSGLYLALTAVNSAEYAGVSADGLPRSVMAQIYLAASIRCRFALPKLFAPVISGYFFRRARRHVRRTNDDSATNLQWLFHPITRKYMSDAKRLEQILQSKEKLSFGYLVEDETFSPLARIRSNFKIYLLAKLLNELVGGDEVFAENMKTILNTSERIDDEIDVLDISSLLISISEKKELKSSNKDESAKFGCYLSNDGDSRCSWWTHVITSGILLRSGKNEQAKSHYSGIRSVPEEILKDHLGFAVGNALCAKKILIHDRESVNMVPYVCQHVTKALASLRQFSVNRSSILVCGFQEGVRRLTYEWLMNSLLDAWRTKLDASQPYWIQTFRGQQNFSILYQESFNHYALITGNRGDSWRLYVYELTCRMLNGANPQATWSGVRRVRSTKMDAARGRVTMRRSAQPDAFHLHTLCKLHSSMDL